MLQKAMTPSKTCKLCKKRVTWVLTKKKTLILATGKHFCTTMNGNCVLKLTFYNKDKKK